MYFSKIDGYNRIKHLLQQNWCTCGHGYKRYNELKLVISMGKNMFNKWCSKLRSTDNWQFGPFLCSSLDEIGKSTGNIIATNFWVLLWTSWECKPTIIRESTVPWCHQTWLENPKIHAMLDYWRALESNLFEKHKYN